MSLFPKFKIPTDTPATLATPATIATFRPESSRNSKSSNPQATQKTDFRVSGEEARRLADNPLTGDSTSGVTAADVLRVFGGGQVIQGDKPPSCRYCNEKKGVLYRSGWRKGGKMIWRNRADGVHVWACHFCGREAKRSRGSVHTIH